MPNYCSLKTEWGPCFGTIAELLYRDFFSVLCLLHFVRVIFVAVLYPEFCYQISYRQLHPWWCCGEEYYIQPSAVIVNIC